MPFGRAKTEQKDGYAPASDESPQGDRSVDRVDPDDAGGQSREDASGPAAFRPTFLEPDERTRPGARPTPTADAFFISVASENGTATHRFDDLPAAQTFVEQLLEQGVPQEEVTAFSGRRAAMEVTQRPVVHLASTREE